MNPVSVRVDVQFTCKLNVKLDPDFVFVFNQKKKKVILKSTEA